MEKRNARPSRAFVVILVSLLCIGAYFLARGIVGSRSSMLRGQTQTSAYAGQPVEALGNGILYSDGTTLHALNERGRQTWSHAAGAGAQFSVDSGGVAIWTGNMLTLLTADRGQQLFSSEVDGAVLDARMGSVFAAVQVGEEHNSAMLVYETSGRFVERIDLAKKTVLDFGFFNNDTLLWIMTLDTEGTVPACFITTYRPGRMLGGTIQDTTQVLYGVLLQASSIRAVGTNYIKDYNYQGKEIEENRMLVYGWYLMGVDERSPNPLMAFVPIDQADGSVGVSDLRMIRGQTDQWMRLPFPAVRVLVKDNVVYAFAHQYVMIARLGEVKPTVYTLPMYVDDALAITDNHTAVVTSGGMVHLLPMP